MGNIDFTQISNLNQLLNNSNCNIPGDVQRDIRTFYKDNNRYGLEKKGIGVTLEYRWNPIKIWKFNYK